jgi:IS605 OrfB family transposase
MKSFFRLLGERKKGNYNRPIHVPNYLKKDGFFPIVFPTGHLKIKKGHVYLGVSKRFRKENNINGKELKFKIPPNIIGQILEVRVIPIHNGNYFKIEFVYEKQNQNTDLDIASYLSIDLGLNNFATCIESINGTAQIICGKYIKSINRLYNKELARLQSIKDKQNIQGYTNAQAKITVHRYNILNEYMNRAVNYILKICLRSRIGNIVIGELTDIKQRINHGTRNNQNFVGIPYYLFKRKLKSKCELYGIKYTEVNEAYTSRTDALAFDEIKSQPYGKSRRIKRGLYKSITGTVINADVNGALNILRKVAGESLVTGIISSGLVNRPQRIRVAFETIKLLSNQNNIATGYIMPTLSSVGN